MPPRGSIHLPLAKHRHHFCLQTTLCPSQPILRSWLVWNISFRANLRYATRQEVQHPATFKCKKFKLCTTRFCTLYVVCNFLVFCCFVLFVGIAIIYQKCSKESRKGNCTNQIHSTCQVSSSEAQSAVNPYY